jgi:hypothetical protein
MGSIVKKQRVRAAPKVVEDHAAAVSVRHGQEREPLSACGACVGVGVGVGVPAQRNARTEM